MSLPSLGQKPQTLLPEGEPRVTKQAWREVAISAFVSQKHLPGTQGGEDTGRKPKSKASLPSDSVEKAVKITRLHATGTNIEALPQMGYGTVSNRGHLKPF